MRKFLKFSDGQTVEIAPLSYEDFMILDLWSSASDMAYEAWKRHHNYVEVRDFNEEALASASLYVVSEQLLEFDTSGDGNYRTCSIEEMESSSIPAWVTRN